MLWTAFRRALAGDWFDLRGFRRTTTWGERLRGTEPPALHAVCKMASGGGRSHGVSLGFMAPPTEVWVPNARHPSPWNGAPWQTLWSKQRIAGGTRALFVTVFVPYDPARRRGGDVQRGVSISLGASSESAVVQLSAAAVAPPSAASVSSIEVQVDIHGAWNVTRHLPRPQRQAPPPPPPTTHGSVDVAF